MNFLISLANRFSLTPLAALAFIVCAAAPPVRALTITAQPQTVTVTAGQDASFAVTASGEGTLSYQWRRRGYSIAGATNATLALTGVSRSQADFYSVVVTDSSGALDSTSAQLLVSPATYPGIVRFEPAAAMNVEDAHGLSAVSGLTLTAEGKMIAVGNFSGVEGRRRQHVVRFNADLTVDDAFVPPRIVASLVYKAVVQPDGKLLVAGFFDTVDGRPSPSLIRLNQNGSLDTAFAPDLYYSSFQISAVAVRPDGKIWVGSEFGRLVRLNSDGSLDTSLPRVSFPDSDSNDYVNVLVPLTDGRLLAGGKTIRRLNADATLDATFVPNVERGSSGVNSIVVQPDGKILIGGGFSAVGGQPRRGIARLNADGTLDPGFVFAPVSVSVSDFALQSDGAIVVTGLLRFASDTPYVYVARLDASGTRDTTFAPDIQGSVNGYGEVKVETVAVRPDQTIVVGGGFSSVNGQARSRLAVFSSTGSLLPALAHSIRAAGTVSTLVAAPGGGAYVAGTFTHLNGQARNHVARLQADGSLDADFDPDVTALVDIGYPTAAVNAIAVQGDGQLLLGGYFARVGGQVRHSLARLNVDGSLDASFTAAVEGIQARVFALTTQLDGKIVLGGYFFGVNGQARGSLARLNRDGSLDAKLAGPIETVPQMSTGPQVLALAVQPDGRLLVGGQFTRVGGAIRNNLARFNADGTVDETYTAQIEVYAPVGALSVQADGRAIAASSILVWLNGDGTARVSAGTAWPLNYYNVRTLLPQDDGQLWVAGRFNGTVAAPLSARILRLRPDGVLDGASAFDAGTANFSTVNALLLTDAGQLWAGSRESGCAGIMRLVATPGPIISVQPVAAAVTAGQALTLSVTTVGGQNVTYQWARDGAAISGANASTYSVSNAQAQDIGSYTVLITYAGGSLTSRAAAVTVAPSPPTIFSPPSARITGFGGAIKAGSHWALVAPTLVSGSTPLSYQWSKDGVILSGATDRAYSPFRWQGEDAGLYQVTISNSLGTVTSAVFPQLVTFGADWRWLAPTPQGNRLSTVLYAGGRFIAAGLRGTIFTSFDGSSWTARRLGVSSSLTALAHGNGLYVALGSSNGIWTSSDTVNWSLRSAGTTDDGRFFGFNPNALTFGNGRFVAVGGGGLIVSSTDGITWSVATAVTTDFLGAVAYGNGRFIALGEAGRTIVSTDGQTWSRGSAVPEEVSFVAFGAGVFVAARSNFAYTSADGATWVRRSLPTAFSVNSLQFTDAGFLAVAADTDVGRYVVSTDGVTWAERSMGLSLAAPAGSLTHGAGAYVAVGGAGDTLLSSGDGATWRRPDPGAAVNFTATAASATTLVVVGSGGAIRTSSDGETWSEPASGTTNLLSDVTFASDQFVAVGAGGTIVTSANGAAWTLRPSGTTADLRGISFLGDRFFAVGTAGAMLTSTDGAVWASVSTGSGETFLGSVYGAGRYLVTATSGIYTSTDRVVWTQQLISGLTGEIRAAYANGLFVLVSTVGGISTSPDGVNWTARTNPLADAPLPTARGLSGVDYVAGRFVALSTGSSSTYLTSLDGVVWTAAQHGSANVINGFSLLGANGFAVGNGGTILSHPLPTIRIQPVSEALAAGSATTLAVLEGTHQSFTVQWRKDGVAIPGASASRLPLTNVSLADAGVYVAIVSTSAGALASVPAIITVLPSGAPVIGTHPVTQTASVGQLVTLTVVATGVAPLRYQWKKNGVELAGATTASFQMASIQTTDAATYSVDVSNGFGVVGSRVATLSVVASGNVASHATVGAYYVPGGTLTVLNTLTYSGDASVLAWSVSLPAGWSFVSDGGAVGDIKPAVGTTGALDWAWTSPPAGSVTFSYTVAVPSSAVGRKSLAAVALVRPQGGGAILQLPARPDPLTVGLEFVHAADVDQDLRLNLAELTRVLELYNTRTGTVRTGRYITSTGAVDGFSPDPAVTAGPIPTTPHTADLNRDGRLSLTELTRVIELFNTRAGTTRTGAYHAAATPTATEDGFAPGP
jgi:uncharacterized delta-60 repeat protein